MFYELANLFLVVEAWLAETQQRPSRGLLLGAGKLWRWPQTPRLTVTPLGWTVTGPGPVQEQAVTGGVQERAVTGGLQEQGGTESLSRGEGRL